MSRAANVTIEQVPIDLLRPDPKNPRRISDAVLDALERSILEFGWVQPIVARREDGIVVGGNQRLFVARRMGLTTVPVIWVDLSIKEARLLGLGLNQIHGEWDQTLLARMLAELGSTPGLDLSLSGFPDDEVKALLRRLDVRQKRDQLEDFDLDAAFGAATREPRTKTGDLWTLGEHHLLCGDATRADDVNHNVYRILKELPPNRLRLTRLS
jgi:ParB-like nuclease domain